MGVKYVSIEYDSVEPLLKARMYVYLHNNLRARTI